MSFAKEFSKLLTNKYFLYFMFFLATTNVLGYLVTNKMKAVVFFALVSIITYQFSKNMAVVLLVAIIATNFLMANKMMREGLENNQQSDKPMDNALERASDTDAQIASAMTKINSGGNNETALTGGSVPAISPSSGSAISSASASAALKTTSDSTIDINNADLNKNSDKSGIQGVGEQISNNKKTKPNENFGPRLDYAATIEQSYQNLDQLLGNDSIKQLSTDTQKLMQQQQNLFNTMNQMVPVLEGAKNMLGSFDMKGITDSLKSVGNINDAPTALLKPKA